VCKKIIALKIILVLQFMILTGCTVNMIHDESYVSDSIQTRTGHELRLEEEKEGIFKIPDNVSLEDGLTEEEAVAIALWNNAQFQADLVDLGFARADLIEAGLLKNPVLSFLFPLGPKQLEATLSLPIDFFWKRPKRVAAAKLDAEQVAGNLIQHGLDFIRDVLLAYAELVSSQERAKITEEESDLRSEIAIIASDRLKFGDISGLEESAFHLEAARALEALVYITRDAELAKERLRTLLGLGTEDIELKITPTLSSTEFNQQSSDLLAKAFAARPDLRAAEIAIEAAGYRLGWEQSKIFNITAVLDANGEGKEGFEMGPGLLMELPILNQNNGMISRAQAELTKAARQYLAVKHRIVQEVHEALNQYQSAQRALKILHTDILPGATMAADNATLAYSVGEMSYLELLYFRQQLLDSRLRKVEAEADVRRTETILKHSIGFDSLNKDPSYVDISVTSRERS
jgi:cobalt-zinc-cadmium efflux system outer membrane protein